MWLIVNVNDSAFVSAIATLIVNVAVLYTILKLLKIGAEYAIKNLKIENKVVNWLAENYLKIHNEIEKFGIMKFTLWFYISITLCVLADAVAGKDLFEIETALYSLSLAMWFILWYSIPNNSKD